MSLFISSVFTYDEDAGNYIQAVEGPSGDNQALEPATRKAINNFVLGCKQDGIWTAIKASCILAGARTLAGALVPLVGTAPTNNGFIGIGTDYVRKTGLVGDGSTKYLDSNRNNNADPQNSNHNAIWVSQGATVLGGLIGIEASNVTGSNNIFYDTGANGLFFRNRAHSLTSFAGATPCPTGFIGHSRSAAASFLARANLSTITVTQTSGIPFNGNIFVFRRALAEITDARLAFYSIGESLDLALLDARVTDLINAFAVTIP
jgi:hypothetical protein